MKIRKSKYLILLFALIAVFSWHFVNINVTCSQPVALSYSAPVAFAQTTSTGPGYLGFLTSMLNGNNKDLGWFDGIYNFSRGLLNIILLAFLVYAAFRNILNAGIDNYGVKKILPKLIFAAFLGNLIRPVMAVASKIVDTLVNGNITIFKTPASWWWIGSILTGVEHSVSSLVHTGAGITSLITGGIVVVVLAITQTWLFVLSFVVILVLLMVGMCLINLFHAIAPWIVLFATAVGPIAIGLSILPETESMYKKWLKIIVFWLFFPVIINAVFYLMSIVPAIPPATGDGAVSALVSAILPMLIKIGLFALAIRIPFTWEKDVGGLIAGLPSAASNTFKSGRAAVESGIKKTGGVVLMGRGMATKAEGQTRMDTLKSSKSSAEVLAGNRYANPENEEQETKKKTLQSSAYFDIARKNPTLATQVFGTGAPSRQKMDTMFAQYQDPAQRAGLSNEQRAFFRGNVGAAVRTSKAAFVESESGIITQEAGDQAVEDLQKNRGSGKQQTKFNVGRFLEKYTISNLPSEQARREETDEAEKKKSGMRYDVLGHKVGGPLADTKSQTDRKDSDFSRLKSTDAVMKELKGTIEKFAIAVRAQAKAKGQKISIESAREIVRSEFDRLDQKAESTYLYNGEWLGAGEGKDKINTSDLGTMIAGYNRLRDLAASESRSIKSPEEQQLLRDQLIGRAFQGGPSAAIGAPSPRISGGPDDVGSPSNPANRDFVPLGTRQINENLDRINDTLAGLDGVDALAHMNQTFGPDDFKDVKIEDYNRFSGDNEGVAQAIGRLVSAKAGGTAGDDFVTQLKMSHGLSTSEMMRQANQFGVPEIPKMVLDYNRRQKMELTILSRNEEVRALQAPATRLAAEATAHPEIVNQITNSLETYVKSLNGVALPPGQLDIAKQFLVARVGLSDPTQLTPKMAADLSSVKQAMTIRHPAALDSVNRPMPQGGR